MRASEGRASVRACERERERQRERQRESPSFLPSLSFTQKHTLTAHSLTRQTHTYTATERVPLDSGGDGPITVAQFLGQGRSEESERPRAASLTVAVTVMAEGNSRGRDEWLCGDQLEEAS